MQKSVNQNQYPPDCRLKVDYTIWWCYHWHELLIMCQKSVTMVA